MRLESLLGPIGRLTTKELSPMQAWSTIQVDGLVSDHLSTKGCRIVIDGVSVSLTHRQKDGEPIQQIPRNEFNKLVQWYAKPQKLRTVRQVMASVLRIGKEMTMANE